MRTPVELSALYEHAKGEIARLRQAANVPGVMHCPKCNHWLRQSSISPGTGEVSARQDAMRCPKGCGPMWPLTWEQHAKHLEGALDRLFLENQSLRASLLTKD